MAVRTVRAGQPIKSAITATWFNNINKRQKKAADPRTSSPENPVRVRCVASGAVDLARFDAANIVGPAVGYEDFDGDAVQYGTVACEVDDTLVADRWGIVQGYCNVNQSSMLTVLGVTWANFEYTADDTHVDIVGGALVSGTYGRGLILSPPEDTGKPGLILIGNSTGIRFYRFTLNEAWDAGVADADILEMDGTDTGIDADINDPLGIFDTLGDTDAGYCFLQDGNYYAIQAPCP